MTGWNNIRAGVKAQLPHNHNKTGSFAVSGQEFSTRMTSTTGHSGGFCNEFQENFRIRFSHVYGVNDALTPLLDSQIPEIRPVTGLQNPCLRVILGVFKRSRARWCTYQREARDEFQ